ncbi:MAG: hypothetical protein OQK78_09000 [Gammaproteobacteria bacterium]|nr:hypothetical protein [Gammaproteobacteria bacterium]
MDETEYKETYKKVNEIPCTFSKAILRRCCGCRHAQKLLLAEREAMACLSVEGQLRCEKLLPLLRQKAAFALKLTHIDGKLPFGKEIKVQCGSMLGLQQELEANPVQEPKVEDIYNLIDQAEAFYDSINNFPFNEMVRTISHFKAR